MKTENLTFDYKAKRKLNPQTAFLVLSIFFGLLILILNPPFQVPDEINHFYRAWQVSTGNLSSVQQNQRLGGYVPKSLVCLTTEYRPYTFNPYNNISPKQLWQTRLIELNPTDTIFKDFANTALYSGLIYIPQATGILLGKLFNLNPFWLVYLGRLTNLLFFIILMYAAIKLVPVKKWLFVVLVFLPMALFIHSSLSADMLVNAICFLLLAFILNLAYNDNVEKIKMAHFLLLLLLSVLIGMAKLVYVPIVFLLIIVPKTKFSSPKYRLSFLVFLFLAGISSALIQKSVIDSKYIPYSDYNVAFRDNSMLNPGVDINKQIDFIKENPKRTVIVFIKSFFNEFKPMTSGYVGVLGWNDIGLPKWFIYLAYLIIFVLTLFRYNSKEPTPIGLLHRIYFFCIAGLVLLLVMLSQYLSWDKIGEGRVYPLQGRYFIPVFPLVFISVMDIFKIRIKYIKPILISILAIAFAILSGILSVHLIAKKSYTTKEYSSVKWKYFYSDAFKNKHSSDTLTSLEYIVLNTDTIASITKPDKRFLSTKKTFNSKQSLLLNEDNPYGFTIKISEGLAYDKIMATFRSFGKGALLVAQEFPEGLYYQTNKSISKNDSLGWSLTELNFILPNDIPENKELRIFVWYPGNDSIYIDDFKLKYYE